MGSGEDEKGMLYGKWTSTRKRSLGTETWVRMKKTNTLTQMSSVDGKQNPDENKICKLQQRVRGRWYLESSTLEELVSASNNWRQNGRRTTEMCGKTVQNKAIERTIMV